MQEYPPRRMERMSTTACAMACDRPSVRHPLSCGVHLAEYRTLLPNLPGWERKRWCTSIVSVSSSVSGSARQASYIGRDQRKERHRREYDLWTGSHHEGSMDRATELTVLGDFSEATFRKKLSQPPGLLMRLMIGRLRSVLLILAPYIRQRRFSASSSSQPLE